MSKEVDALVIVGHAHVIANEPPLVAYDDIVEDLHYIRSGHTEWHNGQPITDERKVDLYAGEVFMELGSIASFHLMGERPTLPFEQNPLRLLAHDTFKKISPFRFGRTLPKPLRMQYPVTAEDETGLPEMFIEPLEAKPSMESELREKWQLAKAVHAKRGKVVRMVMDMDKILDKLEGQNIKDMAPDNVIFDKDFKVVSEAYDLDKLIERAGLQPEMATIPYYQAFATEAADETTMLRSALEDLRLVSKAIRKKK